LQPLAPIDKQKLEMGFFFSQGKYKFFSQEIFSSEPGGVELIIWSYFGVIF
jgi:hypothetical protein